MIIVEAHVHYTLKFYKGGLNLHAACFRHATRHAMEDGEVVVEIRNDEPPPCVQCSNGDTVFIVKPEEEGIDPYDWNPYD